MTEIERKIETAIEETRNASPELKARWINLLKQAKESFKILTDLIDYAFPEFKTMGVHDMDIPAVEGLLREVIFHHYQPEGVVKEDIIFRTKIKGTHEVEVLPGNLYTTILMHGVWIKHDVVKGVEAFQTPEMVYIYKSDHSLVIPSGHPALNIMTFNNLEIDSDRVNALNEIFNLPGIDENDTRPTTT